MPFHRVATNVQKQERERERRGVGGRERQKEKEKVRGLNGERARVREDRMMACHGPAPTDTRYQMMPFHWQASPLLQSRCLSLPCPLSANKPLSRMLPPPPL